MCLHLSCAYRLHERVMFIIFFLVMFCLQPCVELQTMLPSLKDHPSVKAWEWIKIHVHIKGIHGISIYEDLRDKSSQVKLKLQNFQSNLVTSSLKSIQIIQLANSFGCVRLLSYGNTLSGCSDLKRRVFSWLHGHKCAAR